MRNLIVFVVLGAVSLLLRNSEAANYEVGGSGTGWTRPSSSSVYSDWASDKTFAIGDTLTFTFTTGAHDVATVSKSDYDNCNVASQNNVLTSGPATITLNATGDYYFLCTIAGPLLCRTEISHYHSCRHHPLTTRDTFFTASASAASLSRLKSCCYLCSGVHVQCH
ncbi:PEELING CUPREDOXIN putative-RELATED [Salix purpurea]|uniref:PEELING CUPREDOXIN putative-RELATED n=1 Tax=Salix purpurea TaxID=77065 RepID=A0A9Q0Q4G0_SALPP|nr:PEELING CUPREDOXIN putative-RELATED [Salix purpurea]